MAGLLAATLAAATVRGSAPQESAEAVAVRRHVELLAGPDCAGRGLGAPGGEVAIRYLDAEFERLGLRPFGSLGGFRQPFEIDDPRPATFGPGTRLEVPGGGCEHALGQDFVPFGFSPDGAAEGRLVFAGYGLSIPQLGHDDYGRLDCDGAVVLVMRLGPTRGPDGAAYVGHKEAMWFRSKLANAKAAGAVGLLMVDPELPGDEREAAALALAARARGAAEIPCAWISRRVAERLLSRLGVDLDTRRARLDEDPTDASALHAIGEVKVRLEVRATSRPGRLTTANVVGVLPGNGGDGRVLVVGAHHDGLGRGEIGSWARDRVGEVHPGADDNASGVAALLQLAALLAAPEAPRLGRDVVFVAFGAGAIQPVGSAQFLDSGLADPARILAMLNFDMVGRATADRLVVAGMATAAAFERLVPAAGRAVGIDPLRTVDGLLRQSDHARFVRARVPSLLLHSGVDETCSRPDDVASLVMMEETARVARLAAELLRGLDGLDAPLRFREIDR